MSKLVKLEVSLAVRASFPQHIFIGRFDFSPSEFTRFPRDVQNEVQFYHAQHQTHVIIYTHAQTVQRGNERYQDAFHVHNNGAYAVVDQKEVGALMSVQYCQKCYVTYRAKGIVYDLPHALKRQHKWGHQPNNEHSGVSHEPGIVPGPNLCFDVHGNSPRATEHAFAEEKKTQSS